MHGVMDRWTFSQLVDKDEFDKAAIKAAFNVLAEEHRVLKNTLNAVSAVITIN